MLGRARLDGIDTIAFSLVPREAVDPQTDEGERISNFTVKAWLSEADYELVRVDAEAIKTVTIGFGLLARVHPGSTFSFLRRKIDDVWLPAMSSYTGSARVGLVKVLRRHGSSEYSQYRRVPDTAASVQQPGAASN
jgi:hypothetical protein